MQTDKEEVEVFSMSALDLFASALGAFMLLAVVSLPFFSNTGASGEQAEPYLEAAAAARARAAEIDAERQQVEEETREARAATDAVTLPSLDLVIVLDITNSMQEEIATLRRELVSLQLVLERLAPEVAIGVVTFSDVNQNPVLRQAPLRLVTDRPDNLAEVQGFLNDLETANGGQDWAEAIDLGLERAFADDFRDTSEVRLVVLITDSYPREAVQGATLGAIRGFAGDPRNRVSAVSVGEPGSDAARNREFERSLSFLREAAAAGNGRFARASYSVTASIIDVIL